MANHLTLYSSGIGVFVREFPVNGSEQTEIRFPIKKSHRGDVISSLRLFGKVTQKGMVGWPQEEKTQLNIDPENAQESILSQLSGRKISFRLRGGNAETKTGTNLGIQKTEEMFGGNTVAKSHLLVLSDDGEQNRYPLDQIENLKFTEAEVQSEITKALLNNAARLREGVTYVSLSLVGNTGAKSCALQYAHPMPSWQPTYRLTETVAGKFLLSCFAKADIDSEEDLPDCCLTFIVGEPDTFETDLAESKIPSRPKVNLVKQQVSGGHMVEEGMAVEYGCADLESVGGSPRYAARGVARGFAPAAPASAPALLSVGTAKTMQAEAAEVGDYSRWTTPTSFDLKSRQSGLIPLFDGTEVSANRVLYYSNRVDAKRAKLAIHLTNSLKQSLGKGVCTVYREEEGRSDLTGTAVLQSIKPGKTTMLLYGTETGVLVRQDQSSVTPNLRSFSLSKGVLCLETLSTATVTYRLKNNKAEEFKVVVDHDRVVPGSQIDSGKSQVTESLDNGVRLAITLPANGEAALTIVETRIDTQSVIIGTFQLWQNYFSQYGEKCNLGSNKDVQAIIAAQTKVGEVDAQITATHEEITRLTNTQNRVLGLIKGGAGAQAQTQEWEGDISVMERNLRENEKKLSTLTKARNDLLTTLSETIKKAAVNWSDKNTKADTIK